MARKNPHVSVVIPVFNERENIEQLLLRIKVAFLGTRYSYECIVIDDHSTDGTYEFLTSYKKIPALIVLQKSGKTGKAYSLVEGFARASGDYFVMIDADLQYPAEAVPQMLEKLRKADIVVAQRKKYQASTTRRFFSRGFRLLFGKMLFGMSYDIQSGLKVFKREVVETVKLEPRSAWTFDLEFLHRARLAGFTIHNHDISFHARKNGMSNVKILSSITEIGGNAISVRMRRVFPQHVPPATTATTMRGAGVGYKKKRYITHTTLPHHKTAIRTFELKQKLFIFSLLAVLGVGLYVNTLLTATLFVGVLSVIYFIDVLFNLFLIVKSLAHSPEIVVSEQELATLSDQKLPVYTILCPLYKEEHVIPHFIESIQKLDYPKNKLDVILLLEEDDVQTINVVKQMNLPFYVRTVMVPHSQPKTKPKACNYGLSHARGEYLVIYDAEDMPDPLQLKKAILAFKKAPKNVKCLQAKLNYYNPHQNILTRLFTAEYSLWFDVTLTGLQGVNTSIPLGGTSNHFRVSDLQSLQGWDPFNVTEDADLGIRLFKEGYQTAMIDSTTLEEANSKFTNWLRQRSRWIKGYMQTYLVHMRQTLSFTRKKGIHAFLFQLTIGGKIAFILINPFLWVLTISYFTLYAIVGPTIEYIYPSYIFYMAATSLVFGNFLFLYYYMIGCARRGHWALMKYIFLVPFYWIMISIAGFIALYQLIVKPHYWEKTVHGLHLKDLAKKVIPQAVIETQEEEARVPFPNPFRTRYAYLIQKGQMYISGSALIAGSIVGNVLNLGFSVLVQRSLTLADFALLSLISSLWYVLSIPFSAVSATVNYRSGFLFGRYGKDATYLFWQRMRARAYPIALISYVVWLVASVGLQQYFKTDSLVPFILFAPVMFFGLIGAIDRGYLFGRLLFGSVAALAVLEPLTKLGFAYLTVFFYDKTYAYAAIPFSVIIGFFLGWIVIVIRKRKLTFSSRVGTEQSFFPWKFFTASALSGLSTMGFLSMDILLATHYLPPAQAGVYALVSLVGKMVFFMGSLSSQFVIPLVSVNEGAKRDSKTMMYIILLATTLLSLVGFFAFGVFAPISLPLLLGEKATLILPFTLTFSFALLCFTISRVFVSYYLTKKIYSFPVISFLLSVLQVILITYSHASVANIVHVMLLVGGLQLIFMIVMHLNVSFVKVVEQAFTDLFGLFEPRYVAEKKDRLRILILNWRDTKHIWAGGAEVYVHELAKQWVKQGDHVSVFCGNDAHSPRKQTIEGVDIIRRGGKYMVYPWAVLYYLLRFRGQYDVVIDSENGIPFFTPLFVRKPIFLLMHHVHQDVFREHLVFPFSHFARFLEATLMPMVYRNIQVIAVSDSTKREITLAKIAKEDSISIVYPGIHQDDFAPAAKSRYPMLTYLGRLKPYKNVDIPIRAFEYLVKLYPNAQLHIVGEGESQRRLEALTTALKLDGHVQFHGKITEGKKAELLSKSWVVVQPSMIEGWGITVIEANASGTPVIASDVSGLRDSIVHGSTGVLVEARNVDAMLAAMVDFLGNSKFREDFGKRAYLWSKNFSWEKSATRFYNIVVDNLDKKYKVVFSADVSLAKNK